MLNFNFINVTVRKQGAYRTLKVHNEHWNPLTSLKKIGLQGHRNDEKALEILNWWTLENTFIKSELGSVRPSVTER